MLKVDLKKVTKSNEVDFLFLINKKLLLKKLFFKNIKIKKNSFLELKNLLDIFYHILINIFN